MFFTPAPLVEEITIDPHQKNVEYKSFAVTNYAQSRGAISGIVAIYRDFFSEIEAVDFSDIAAIENSEVTIDYKGEKRKARSQVTELTKSGLSNWQAKINYQVLSESE